MDRAPKGLGWTALAAVLLASACSGDDVAPLSIPDDVVDAWARDVRVDSHAPPDQDVLSAPDARDGSLANDSALDALVVEADVQLDESAAQPPSDAGSDTASADVAQGAGGSIGSAGNDAGESKDGSIGAGGSSGVGGSGPTGGSSGPDGSSGAGGSSASGGAAGAGGGVASAGGAFLDAGSDADDGTIDGDAADSAVDATDATDAGLLLSHWQTGSDPLCLTETVTCLLGAGLSVQADGASSCAIGGASLTFQLSDNTATEFGVDAANLRLDWGPKTYNGTSGTIRIDRSGLKPTLTIIDAHLDDGSSEIGLSAYLVCQ